ncbi:MAG: GxxExxY protein [Planctomycetota bacterium]|nr:GxxExxY protein [Planctomycetota bacterium]
MTIGPHEKLTRRILRCAFRVQNTLGCRFLEKVYENALMITLKQEGLDASQQVSLRVHFEKVLVGQYVADIIVAGAVLIEIKVTEENHPVYVAQVPNYLKATNLPVGLLINFGGPRLCYRRLTLRQNADSGTIES